MGKTIQRFIITIIFAVSLSAYSQCDPELMKVNIDTNGCKTVEMSQAKWGYYWLADRNLQAIEDSIPALSYKIEQERARADSAQARTEEQIKAAQTIILLHKEGREDCDDALVAIALKNSKYKKRIDNHWKVSTIAGFGGAILGLLLGVLIAK